MGGNTNNGRAGGPAQTVELQRLITLIEQFEEHKLDLDRALGIGDRELITQYDQDINQVFEKILAYRAAETQTRVLLAEFLFDQLQVDNSSFTDRIKLKLIDIVRNE